MYLPIWLLILIGMIFIKKVNNEIARRKRYDLYVFEGRLRSRNPHHPLDEGYLIYDKWVDEEILHIAVVIDSDYVLKQSSAKGMVPWSM